MAGLTTPLSLVFAFSLFIGAIMYSTNNYIIFLSFSSFVMVFGGTMSAEPFPRRVIRPEHIREMHHRDAFAVRLSGGFCSHRANSLPIQVP